MQRMYRPAVLGSTVVLAAVMAVSGCSGVQGERSGTEQTLAVPAGATQPATGVAHAKSAPTPSIPAYFSDKGDATIFSDAAKQSGIFESLRGLGPYTVLAPTDEAFEKLGNARMAELMDPANHEDLARLVSCHIIPGRWTLDELRRMSSLPTIGGWYLLVGKADEETYLGTVKLSEPSLVTDQLVVYTVEDVFDPDAMTTP